MVGFSTMAMVNTLWLPKAMSVIHLFSGSSTPIVFSSPPTAEPKHTTAFSLVINMSTIGSTTEMLASAWERCHVAVH